MEIGNKIFNLRKSAKMSQEQLAEKLNVTRQTISNWELGQTLPDIAQAKEIARIFSISLDELTDNDVKDILVEKVTNTEKKVGKTIKVLKGVLIAIICLIIIMIVSIVLFAIKNNNKQEQKEEQKIIETQCQEFYCTINDLGYTYYIKYDESNKILNTSWVLVKGYGDKNTIYSNAIDITKYDDLEQLITDIKSFYEDKGGNCERIDENHMYYIYTK